MSNFTPRLSEPSRDNGYYFGGDNIFEVCGYGMPNCTAYAFGRLFEITDQTFGALSGNAEQWWAAAQNAGYQVGSEPKLGAVICWKAYDEWDESDGAGHVAVVEEIYPNGDILTSNSGWQGDMFFTRDVSRDSGYQYSEARQFQGFIYCGIDFDGSEDSQPTPEAPSEPIIVPSGTIKEIILDNTPCYGTSSDESYGTKTGTFYIWSDEVINGRIRITNQADRVGVEGQVSCWVDATFPVNEESAVVSGDIGIDNNVTINNGAKDYTGSEMADFVYGRINKVIDVSGDRIVVQYDGVTVGAFNKADLTIV